MSCIEPSNPNRRPRSARHVLLAASLAIAGGVLAEAPVHVLDVGRHVIEHRDGRTGQLLATVALSETWILDETAHVVSDGNMLYVGTNPDEHIWPALDAASGRRIGSLVIPIAEQRPMGMVMSREHIVRLLIRTATDPARLQIIDREDNTVTSRDLPIGSPQVVTDVSWGPNDGEVFVGTWSGAVYQVSLEDGTSTESLATGLAIRHLEYHRATSELLILDAGDSLWHALSWPDGQGRLLPYGGEDLTTGTGETPRDFAPPMPWADVDGNAVADWFEARFAQAQPPLVLGDSDGDGVARLQDCFHFYRVTPEATGVLRFDLNLDGRADWRDAEVLYRHRIAPTSPGGLLPSLE